MSVDYGAALSRMPKRKHRSMHAMPNHELPARVQANLKAADRAKFEARRHHARDARREKHNRRMTDTLDRARHKVRSHAYTLGRKDLERMFRNYDRDNNGLLDIHEFTSLMRRVGGVTHHMMAAKKMHRLYYQTVDTNGDGGVSLEEFIEWVNEDLDDEHDEAFVATRQPSEKAAAANTQDDEPAADAAQAAQAAAATGIAEDDETKERIAEIARLEAKEQQYRITRQQNEKLRKLLKDHEDAKARKEQREQARQQQATADAIAKGTSWRKKRYEDRLAARAATKTFQQRSPRYRPGHSSYQPSSRSGVPKTGGDEYVRYSNFSREARFKWQRVKDTNPGPADYNPNTGNNMEQYVYVDYVKPYAHDDVAEAKRELDLMPGILRLQDRDSIGVLVSKRKQILDTGGGLGDHGGRPGMR